MKESTRGFLEKSIDNMIEDEKFQHSMMNDIAYFKNEIPIASLKDLTLGFTLGALFGFSASILVIKEGDVKTKDADENEILAMLKRRLPEILDGIEKELNK